MTSNNEYFDPEQVDEQIEQLQRPKRVNTQTDEVQLVNLLRSTYRAPFSTEDRASLERARERIIGKKSIEAGVDAQDYEVHVGRMREIHPVAHPRHAHFTRMLSGLAAIFIVGALIGSWLTITHMMSPPPLASATQEDLYTIHSSIVYHFDGSNGKLIWQHSVPTRALSNPNYGGNVQLRVINHVVYAMLDYDIYALDARTGNQLWHVTNSTDKEYFWVCYRR